MIISRQSAVHDQVWRTARLPRQAMGFAVCVFILDACKLVCVCVCDC